MHNYYNLIYVPLNFRPTLGSEEIKVVPGNYCKIEKFVAQSDNRVNDQMSANPAMHIITVLSVSTACDEWTLKMLHAIFVPVSKELVRGVLNANFTLVERFSKVNYDCFIWKYVLYYCAILLKPLKKAPRPPRHINRLNKAGLARESPEGFTAASQAREQVPTVTLKQVVLTFLPIHKRHGRYLSTVTVAIEKISSASTLREREKQKSQRSLSEAKQ